MELNSILSGARNGRSINVRANILAEWTADQVRICAQVTRSFVGIGICVALLATVIPVTEGARMRLAGMEATRQRELSQLNAQVAQAAALQKAAAPSVAASLLRTRTFRYFGRMMGEIYAVLDAANLRMAFSSAKAEVRGAEMSIDCHADAQNYGVAATFAKDAGTTPNEVSSLASTRPNALMGLNGVSFEYMKKVDLK